MLLIPAIDLKNGQCVRLRQGKMDDATVFSDDPAAVARRWADEGAQRLHVVDLDGAMKGQPINFKAVEKIIGAVKIPVQVGGGVRDEDTVQRLLNAGAQYVVVGTKAVTAPHFLHDLCIEYPRHVLVAIDARDGRVALNGWNKITGHDAIECAIHCERDGAEAIIYTDISRDGMMSGFNAEGTRQLAKSVKTPVYASGGISSLKDLAALKEIEPDGIVGCVIGRALYEGTFTLKDAMKAIA
ncbi:MAG TPA: 1-(5-phosphoribosyl)-5-[(5-phosphoribosylamino)methylideneamino]imidazole-4-carboxamide isomerase [Candidatus Binatia bacterium]|nr:1-(5-phosphoribosyl)-5-[(5-phosphoribosylamino)methylideneamino]imidazole-4-carboxamide isomerase [Candidatus Binatia bacterium]